MLVMGRYGTRDIVRHGETGLLVEQHEPDAVAAALEQVLTEPGALDRMRRAARAHAGSFSVPTVVQAFGQALAVSL